VLAHQPIAGVIVTTTQLPTPARAAPRGAGIALQVEHLTKRYGATTVLDDVSFVVAPGRVTGFLGPNGSGKSTTMKILLGLASADAGHATIDGQRYRDLADPARTAGVVLEPNAFHPARSGRAHLEILATIAGIPAGRVDEVLALMGLEHAADRRAGAYSLGMKQRLSLAGALLGDPPVLVLDEPGNGLDPQGIRSLRELLRQRADEGHTVFLSSHLLSEVEHLADEVVVLDHGRLVTTGPLGELQAAATRVRCHDPGRLGAALVEAGALVEARPPDGLLVRNLAIEAVGDLALQAGVALHELAADTSSLEELFFGWTDAATGPETMQTEEPAS
jgi:ABC-2 type transport system ATP-binding protein